MKIMFQSINPYLFLLTSSQSPSIVSNAKRRLKSLEKVKTAVEE